MKDTIYLICDATGVQKLKHNPPRLKKGQVAVKVIVSVDGRVFMPPGIAEVKLGVELPIPTLDRRTVSVTQAKGEV